ncbi:MAG TPA: Rap1a/Tai family immunity protein [Rhizomicrobium sp.]|jgi:hypothetical protein|nr:Rap1a/Tai family immunity protein [Rhizomicrobium sp.]
MRIILAAGLLLAMSQPGQCGALSDFLKLHDEPLGRDQTETQIAGIQSGFFAANTWLTGTLKTAPMYCQPETLNLTAGQLVEMLRRGVKEHPELDDSDPASALLAVMQRTFPCVPSLK